MTLTAHMVALIAMAVFVMTILVVGTLAAADILRFGRRSATASSESTARR